MKSCLLGIGLILSFILGFVMDGLITRIPEDDLVATRMHVLEREIRNFYRQTRELPISLDALDQSVVGHCRESAWGSPISYVVTNGTEVVLQTFGWGGASAEVVQTFVRRFDVKGK